MNLWADGCQALWMNDRKDCRLNVSMTDRETVPFHKFAEIQRGNQEDIYNLRSEPNSDCSQSDNRRGGETPPQRNRQQPPRPTHLHRQSLQESQRPQSCRLPQWS